MCRNLLVTSVSGAVLCLYLHLVLSCIILFRDSCNFSSNFQTFRNITAENADCGNSSFCFAYVVTIFWPLLKYFECFRAVLM